MKHLIIATLFLVLGCSTLPVEQIQNQEIITIQNMNKEQIFKKTTQWLAESFGSSNAVIQYKDLNEGKFICQIITSAYSSEHISTVSFHTTMTIDIKDGKTRFTFLAHDMSGNGQPYGPIYNVGGSQKLVQESFKTVKTSYLNFMTNKKSDNNW